MVVFSLGTVTYVGTLGVADVMEETSGIARGLIYIGGGSFLGTWVYDIVFAPISCLRKNYSLLYQENNIKVNLVSLTLRF